MREDSAPTEETWWTCWVNSSQF